MKAAAAKAGLGEKYQMIVLPEAKTFSDILREGLLSDVRMPASLKLDAATTLLSSLPAELQAPTRQAMRLLQSLQSENVLLTLPPGIVESHPSKKSN